MRVLPRSMPFLASLDREARLPPLGVAQHRPPHDYDFHGEQSLAQPVAMQTEILSGVPKLKPQEIEIRNNSSQHVPHVEMIVPARNAKSPVTLIERNVQQSTLPQTTSQYQFAEIETQRRPAVVGIVGITRDNVENISTDVSVSAPVQIREGAAPVAIASPLTQAISKTQLAAPTSPHAIAPRDTTRSEISHTPPKVGPIAAPHSAANSPFATPMRPQHIVPPKPIEKPTVHIGTLEIRVEAPSPLRPPTPTRTWSHKGSSPINRLHLRGQ